MNEQEITVVIKEPNKKAYVDEHFIPSLENLHKILGGSLEYVNFGNRLALLCNETGKQLNLKSNLLFPVQYQIDDLSLQKISDIVCGNVIVLAHTWEGEEISLSKAQIEQTMALLDKYDANAILKDSSKEFSLLEAYNRFEELYGLTTQIKKYCEKTDNNGRVK